MAKIHKDKAYRVISKYEDFDGDVEKWKVAFYDLWRLQMTYSFAYNIEVREGHSGVYVSMLVREAYINQTVDTMTEWGFGGIRKDEEPVGIIESYELPDDIEEVFTE